MILAFFLEEPSARALLQGLLPKLLPSEPYIDVRYVVFEGKQDLEKHLVRRLRHWVSPDTLFVVLRDQDNADCRAVKARLCELVTQSGKHALVRIACHELESWVLGDLPALAEAYSLPKLAQHSSKAKFRAPDQLSNPVQELQRIVPDYQKIDGARRLGPHLHPDTNRSTSFRVFCEGVQRLVTQATSHGAPL